MEGHIFTLVPYVRLSSHCFFFFFLKLLVTTIIEFIILSLFGRGAHTLKKKELKTQACTTTHVNYGLVLYRDYHIMTMKMKHIIMVSTPLASSSSSSCSTLLHPVVWRQCSSVGLAQRSITYLVLVTSTLNMWTLSACTTLFSSLFQSTVVLGKNEFCLSTVLQWGTAQGLLFCLAQLLTGLVDLLSSCRVRISLPGLCCCRNFPGGSAGTTQQYRHPRS